MKQLIGEVRMSWDTWDLKDDVQGDDMLQVDSFYSGFMSAVSKVRIPNVP